MPEAGNLIKWEWFQFYDDLPPPTRQTDQIVQSWDTAVSTNDTADWSVCTTWAIRDGHYYLIDVFRARLDFPSLKQKVIELCKQFEVRDVLIENAGAATGLIQQLNRERLVQPIGINPEGSKPDRMAAQTAVIEAGRVYLPTSASWLDEFRTELTAFPSG